MSGHAELDADLILQHSGFIRSLARGLLRDESLVDDVVQETLIKALEKGPRSKSALPAWLRVVTRNIAYKSYRGTARRRAREEEAARPEQTSSTVDIVARGEALENLTSSVMDLPESAREVVFLRYYEGLSHAEIGAQLGLASGAVRMRLHRAQKLLQDRLDRKSDGDRAAWMSGLAGLAGVGLRDIGGGLTPTSGVAPATTAVVALAATTLVCIGVGTMFWLDADPTQALPPVELLQRPELAAVPAGEDVALLDSEPGRSGTAREDAEAALLPLGGASEAASVAAAPEPKVIFPEGTLQGTVVDENGAPVVGGQVYAAWGREAIKRRAETDENGRFGIAAPQRLIDQALDGEFTVLLGARSDDSAPTRVHAWPKEGADGTYGGDHALLKMRGPGGVIRGTVKGSDGRPVVGAKISVGERARLGQGFLGQQSATSENPLAPTLAILVDRVGAPLFQGHRSMRGTLGPQALEADGTRSRLLPAETRRSKADGTFQFRGLELGRQTLRISAPGFAPYQGAVNVREGVAAEVELVLERGATLTGKLTRADGLPPAKGLVHAFHANPYAVQTVRMRSDGTFTLKNLRSGPVRVVAEERLPRESRAPRITAQALELSAGETRAITLDMHKPATAQVRVMVRREGELVPAAGFAVEVRAQVNPVSAMAVYPLDEEGRAEVQLETVRPAEWVITKKLVLNRSPNGAVLDEANPTQSTPMKRIQAPTREEAAEEFVIVLEEREVLCGAVLLSPSIDGVSRFDFRDGFTLFRPDEPFTYVGWSSGKPGQLQFNGVASGDYHIMYPHHGLGWISPFTVSVGTATPDEPQDLGAVELPRLASIDLVLSQDEIAGSGERTRWTDLDIKMVVSTKTGEKEFAVFRGRAEVPGSISVSPGQYVLRDPSRPDLPAKYVNARAGESAELGWH